MSAKLEITNPTADAAFRIVTAHLPVAVAELFGGYDLPVWLAAAPRLSTEREVAASIGFTGRKFRGALMLRASESSIGRWLEAMGMAGGDLSDTLSEFSNMLLGRVKCHLLSQGLPIALATPTAMTGHALRFSTPPAESASLDFEGGDWSIAVRLDASFEVDFELDPTAAEGAAEAGECILF